MLAGVRSTPEQRRWPVNLIQASTLLLAQQEPAAADPGARNPGDMLNDFFASNPG
jgi:hypothetical protein